MMRSSTKLVFFRIGLQHVKMRLRLLPRFFSLLYVSHSAWDSVYKGWMEVALVAFSNHPSRSVEA